MDDPLVVQIIDQMFPDKEKAFRYLKSLTIEQLEEFEAHAAYFMNLFCEETDTHPDAELLAIFRQQLAVKLFMEKTRNSYSRMSEFLTEDYLDEIIEEEQEQLEDPSSYEEMTLRLVKRIEQDFPGAFSERV